MMVADKSNNYIWHNNNYINNRIDDINILGIEGLLVL